MNVSKLRKLRLERDLSQEGLMRLTKDISLRTIQRAEKNPMNCNLKTAKQIADALELTIDETFFEDNEIKKRDR